MIASAMEKSVGWIRSSGWGLAALAGLLLLTIVIAPFSWHLPVMKGITAEFSTDGEHLIISNGNDFVWENTIITINQTYQYRSGLFPRGGTVIPMNAFQNEQGEFFRPADDTLRALTISVPQIREGESGYFEW